MTSPTVQLFELLTHALNEQVPLPAPSGDIYIDPNLNERHLWVPSDRESSSWIIGADPAW